VDEWTGEPVTGGVYPIEITEQSDYLKKAMPYMKVGLTAMKAANGLAGVARMFGVPAPKVPKSVIARASKEVKVLDQESTVAEFGVLQSALDGGGEEKKTLRGAALKELHAFILEKDQGGGFAGLVRICDKDSGKVIWVSEESKQEMEGEEEKMQQAATVTYAPHHLPTQAPAPAPAPAFAPASAPAAPAPTVPAAPPPPPAPSPPAPATAAAAQAADPNRVITEGYLEKKGGGRSFLSSTAYKSRYVELYPKALVYYGKPGDAKAKGTVPVEGGVITLGPDDRELAIGNRNKFFRTLYFKAPTPNKRAYWVKHLQEVVCVVADDLL
jgi:hypothetical protein